MCSVIPTPYIARCTPTSRLRPPTLSWMRLTTDTRFGAISLLEGKRPPTTHPGAMLEIWSALTDILQARTFTNHGLYTVKRRLDTHLCNRQTRAFREDGENREHWPAMVERLESQNVHINYYADLVYRGAHELDVADDESATLHALLDGEKNIDIDNDFRHFLERAQTIGIVWNVREDQFETTGQPIE